MDKVQLSLERFFEDLYYEIKWQKRLRWVRGRGQSYTANQSIMAKKYHQLKYFTDFDFVNCLLHARILCDRSIAFSRYFLQGSQLPSFTSFSDHRKFFIEGKQVSIEHKPYAKYFQEQTEWFEVLKLVRDKFLVHQGPKHGRMINWQSDYDLALTFHIPGGTSSGDMLLSVSVRRLARDIKGFLTWFAKYSMDALDILSR